MNPLLIKCLIFHESLKVKIKSPVAATGLPRFVLNIKRSTHREEVSKIFSLAVQCTPGWVTNLPWSRFSVSQNFCNSLKYLSRINTLLVPIADVMIPGNQFTCRDWNRPSSQHSILFHSPSPQQLVYTATVGRRLASSPPPSQPGPPQVATIGRSAGSGDEVSAFSLAEATSTQHLEQVYG